LLISVFLTHHFVSFDGISHNLMLCRWNLRI